MKPALPLVSCVQLLITVLFTLPAAADTSSLFDRQRGTVRVLMWDTSASQLGQDRALYRDAALVALKQMRNGDRVVVTGLGEAGLGQTTAIEDVEIPATGRHYRDIAALKTAQDRLLGAVSRLYAARATARHTRIFESLYALRDVVTEAQRRGMAVQLWLLSDANESSTVADFARQSWHPMRTTVDALMNKVRTAGLVAALPGARIYVVGAGGNTSPQQYRGVEAFWTTYFQAAGAQLVHYGRMLPTAISAMQGARMKTMTEANGSITDRNARCMTCGQIGSVSLQPDGGRQVALVSPPYEHAARFRAFAEDGSRRPANV